MPGAGTSFEELTIRPIALYGSAMLRIGYGLLFLVFLLREFPNREELWGPSAAWTPALDHQYARPIDWYGWIKSWYTLLATTSDIRFELSYEFALLVCVAMVLGVPHPAHLVRVHAGRHDVHGPRRVPRRRRRQRDDAHVDLPRVRSRRAGACRWTAGGRAKRAEPRRADRPAPGRSSGHRRRPRRTGRAASARGQHHAQRGGVRRRLPDVRDLRCGRAVEGAGRAVAERHRDVLRAAHRLVPALARPVRSRRGPLDRRSRSSPMSRCSCRSDSRSPSSPSG